MNGNLTLTLTLTLVLTLGSHRLSNQVETRAVKEYWRAGYGEFAAKWIEWEKETNVMIKLDTESLKVTMWSGFLMRTETVLFEFRISQGLEAFTQGFESYNGLFYEGTGLRGESELRKVNPSTGEVINKIKLDPQYFGEGITILDGKIYQLTWQSGTGFIYDLEDFSLIREFQIEGEGWGLTNDGKNLLLSNGSDKIMFLDPLTLKIEKKIAMFIWFHKPSM